MNLKQKVPKEFHEHTLLATNHDESAQVASGPVLSVENYNVRAAPLLKPQSIHSRFIAPS